MELKFKFNPGYVPENQDKHDIPLKNSVRFGNDYTHERFLAGEKKAFVQLEHNVNDDNENSPFQIKAVMRSEFIWEANYGEDEIQALLNQNAPALLFSYLRPIIAGITNSAGLPPLNLPFMNFKK